jgi:hypothetical protein
MSMGIVPLRHRPPIRSTIRSRSSNGSMNRIIVGRLLAVILLLVLM